MRNQVKNSSGIADVERYEFLDCGNSCYLEDDAMPDLDAVRQQRHPLTILPQEAKEIMALSGMQQPTGLWQALVEVREEIRDEAKRLRALDRRITTIIKSAARKELENYYV